MGGKDNSTILQSGNSAMELANVPVWKSSDSYVPAILSLVDCQFVKWEYPIFIKWH